MTAAEKLAQAQLDAYNNKDLEKFLACYADDVKIFLQTGEFLYEGKETMRENYGKYFAANPNLHCELLKRIVQGNFAIDHEKITGLSGGETRFAVAIYEVADNLIRKVWFIR